MIEDISNRLMRDFATCLQSRLAERATAPSGAEVTRGEARARGRRRRGRRRRHEMHAEAAAASAGPTTPRTAARPPAAPPDAAKPVNGLSLFFCVLWERIKRLFGSSGGR